MTRCITGKCSECRFRYTDVQPVGWSRVWSPMKPVTPDSIISDVLSSYPDAAAVFERYGLGCPSCLAAGMESVSAVAAMHDVSVHDLVRDLNETHSGSVGEESSDD